MVNTMRAVQLNYDTLSLDVRELKVPDPKQGQVRVKVAAAGVCLSDVKLVSGTLTPPLGTRGVVTLGHEISGVVDEIGAEVAGWEPGDRVTMHPVVDSPRGKIVQGMDFDGGWADYLVVNASALVKLPDELSFHEAAIITDAVSTPWSAITSAARVQAGQSAGVWGLGGLGFHAIKILRMIGASPIVAIDPLGAARERALRAGADVVFNPNADGFIDRLADVTAGTGLTHAFDFVGAPGVREQALLALGHGGQLTIVGAGGQPFTVENVQRIIYGKQKIAGSFGSHIDDLRTLINLTARGRLDLSESVSSVLPLESAAEALDQLKTKTGDPVRIVLDPSQSV